MIVSILHPTGERVAPNSSPLLIIPESCILDLTSLWYPSVHAAFPFGALELSEHVRHAAGIVWILLLNQLEQIRKGCCPSDQNVDFPHAVMFRLLQAFKNIYI